VSYPVQASRVPGVNVEGFTTYFARTIPVDTSGEDFNIFKELNRPAQAGEIRTDANVDVIFNNIGGAQLKRINANETFPIYREWKFAIKQMRLITPTGTANVRVFLV
jgi:hypothetical protein